MGGSPPASSSNTLQLSTSDSLLATTAPAAPDPTTIKSNSSPSRNLQIGTMSNGRFDFFSNGHFPLK